MVSGTKEMVGTSRLEPLTSTKTYAASEALIAPVLLASGHQFYLYRFDRVSPGAAASNFLAQHTAELRYLFCALTDDGPPFISSRWVTAAPSC